MDSTIKAKSWEYEQQAIDVEIKSLEESLRALRHRRNTLAPISSLPPEVIAAIFYLLHGQPDIRVAHVCHRWREIALDHPLFWSHLDFSTISPAGATEILARAGMVPLYLEAKVPNQWDDARFAAFQKELQTHLSHTYRLEISAEPHYLYWTLEGLISPAPALEHLSVSGSNERPTPLSSRVSVPDTLFDATIPKLSSLELSKCNISWKSPLLKSLKHLETIRFSGIERPSLTDWLDALDEMPQLKRLILHSASPSASLFPFGGRTAQRTVTLPSLVHLDISASELDCGLALAHLVLPSLTSLWVTARSNRPHIDDVQKMLPYVAQHAHGPQDPEPLQRVAIRNESTRIVIVAWSTLNIDDTEGDATLSERVALCITTEYRKDLNDHVRILDAAVASLPLDGLVTFTSRDNERVELDAAFWRRHIPRWPLLKQVHLAPLAADGFREMLLTHLCDAHMKLVDQGESLKVLDSCTCTATSPVVRSLSEIVLDVWGPEELETIGTEGPMDPTWDGARSDEYSEEESDDDMGFGLFD